MKNKLFICLLIVGQLFSASVNLNTAEDVALELLNRRNIENKTNYSINGSSYKEQNGDILFYVINFVPTGFVIVSADDRSKPVLGYSFDNAYIEEGIPNHYDYWLGYYAEQIKYIIDEDLEQTELRRNEWLDYLNPNSDHAQVRDVVVGPLITTSWDQSSPYNTMCPGNPPTLVGCVSISMSQVMHYWKYPDYAVGNESYTDPAGQSPSFGTITSNFGTSYDWNNMPNTGATEDTQLLLFEAGVAVHMDYDYDGSGSHVDWGSNSAQRAMKENFDYVNSSGGYPTARNKSAYSSTAWQNIITNELDSGKPMIKQGCSDSGCHAWNIDGYDEDNYVHMNFGWGGSYNGYYSLEDISAGGDTYNSNLGILEDLNPNNLNVPNLELVDVQYVESNGSGDNDNVVNPGEFGNLYVTLENIMPWPEGEDINLILTSENPDVSIISDFVFVDSIESASTYQTDSPFTFFVSPNAEINSYPLSLIVTADGGYERTFDLDFLVSLNQENFPVNLSGQVKGAPVVVDYDNDGTKEVFVGDYLGVVHKYDMNGIEDSTGIFPYDMGNQIWGSLATADIDNDSYADILVTSKSKHLVAFDRNGIKFDYNADSWLMGTPAIGQLDSDPELEIVVGGYSSSARNIYAVNHDGTVVSGFPVDVDERMIVGVALHDFNNNGKDDIVFGTDSDNIHLMHDDGTIVWSYETGDKIQSAPSIINTGNSILICAGSKDDNMYCLDQNGQLQFSVETGGNVFSSPAAVSTDSGLGIFFGSEDGYIYGVNQNGSALPGWPKDTGTNIVGSVSFSDLDNDGSTEVVANNEAGTIFAYHLDGTSIPYFPIAGDFSYASSPQILDFDNDGDLELFAGSSLGVEVFDVKTEGSNAGYWSTHRSNQSRTGYIELSNSSCTTADVNSDGIIDILDIVQTINIAMGFINPTDIQSCAADINSDSVVDVLDIVMMVNIVLGG